MFYKFKNNAIKKKIIEQIRQLMECGQVPLSAYSKLGDAKVALNRIEVPTTKEANAVLQEVFDSFSDIMSDIGKGSYEVANVKLARAIEKFESWVKIICPDPPTPEEFVEQFFCWLEARHDSIAQEICQIENDLIKNPDSIPLLAEQKVLQKWHADIKQKLCFVSDSEVRQYMITIAESLVSDIGILFTKGRYNDEAQEYLMDRFWELCMEHCAPDIIIDWEPIPPEIREFYFNDESKCDKNDILEELAKKLGMTSFDSPPAHTENHSPSDLMT